MSVQAMSWVLDESKSKGETRCVLIAIANHSDHRGRGCYASQARLAREANCSTSTVKRAVAWAVATGELDSRRHAGAGRRRKTNLYWFPALLAGENPVPEILRLNDEPDGVNLNPSDETDGVNLNPSDETDEVNLNPFGEPDEVILNPSPSQMGSQVSYKPLEQRLKEQRLKDTSLSEKQEQVLLPVAKPKRDVIWDALVELFGSAPRTARFRGGWNAAAAELRSQDATPESIREAFLAYKLDMPDVACTPMALAKHYGRLDSPAAKKLSNAERAELGYRREQRGTR